MDISLTLQEARVLGCLMEKEMATPEYYPLSLNALTNACNQKSNREPVVSYDEQTVVAALDGLREKKLVRQSTLSRVPKYEQIFSTATHLVPREVAVICTLLLRGEQTIGEIRNRSERLFTFNSLDETLEALTNLEEMKLVTRLARQPGHKESRYLSLLAGRSAKESDEPVPAGSELVPVEPRNDGDRITELQHQIDELRREMDQLKQTFASFTAQFE